MRQDGGQTTRSCWQDSVSAVTVEQPPLPGDLECDVCVVGAGIAGLTTAYLLAREGKSVIVLDDGPPGGGMTAMTTAHLSNALDDHYRHIESFHGREGARLAAESHTAAIARVEQIVRDEKIACGFTRLPGYLFNPPGEEVEDLEEELKACHRAGLTSVSRLERAPLTGFDTGPCLLFPQQATFHPLDYVHGLAAAFLRLGGRLFRAHADSVEGGEESQVVTSMGMAVKAQHIVVATLTPVNDRVLLHTKQAAYTTHVVAFRVAQGSCSPALFWDTLDPYHYARLAPAGGSDGSFLLVVGGGDHKTGQSLNQDQDHYAELKSWTRERFPDAGEVVSCWSGEVFEPQDFMGFIGRNPGDSDNVFIVTGDSGNGLTHGTLAGILLTDLICGRPNPWQKLYDPSRISPRAAAEFAKENLNVGAQYRDWFTGGDYSSAEEIARGEGGVVRHGLSKRACYRDGDGKLHEMSAVCPHLGGLVRWNGAEKTWDCPCHGSRFDALGTVFVGPANSGLSPVESADEAQPG